MSGIILDCQGFPIPVLEQPPKEVIDLDAPEFMTLFTTRNGDQVKKGDCLVKYLNNGTVIAEKKRSYMKKTRHQLESTVEVLRANWQKFLSIAGLDLNTPQPTRVILCIENGLGHDRRRYEIDNQHNLRERASVRFSGPIVLCSGLNMLVYDRRDVENYYKIWGGK